MNRQVYIASQDREGGILRCELTEQGALQVKEKVPVDRPAYLCAGEGRLYAILREPFLMQSGVVSFRIEKGGRLTDPKGPEPVHGTIAAHLCCRKGKVYCANYLSGTVTLMPDRLIAFNGSGVDRARQDCSHPHCVTETPDRNYLCVNDLGTDRIHILTPELVPISSMALPAGSGPRHLVFSKDGKFAYCANELASTVSVLRYRQGSLRYLRSYPTVSETFSGENAAAAIKLSADGRHLYVSNRGHDSVAEFAAEGEKLRLLRALPCHGSSPRDFAVSGDWLLCANENSDSVTVLSLSGAAETPVSMLPVKRPWCVLPLDTV